jgi:hypothetical protein
LDGWQRETTLGHSKIQVEEKRSVKEQEVLPTPLCVSRTLAFTKCEIALSARFDGRIEQRLERIAMTPENKRRSAGN